jgi:hypothetical protein
VSRRLRVSYYDVVGRALPPLRDTDVGRAITRLSATYRAGKSDFDFSTEVGRAAYCWHLLPAHVSDFARWLYDFPQVLREREHLRVVALGAGPGSETLGLLEAISTLKSRGELSELARVDVQRVDHQGAWDLSHERLVQAARAAVEPRRTGLGEDWQLSSPASLICDLAQGPPSEALKAVCAEADLVVAANLVSEVSPRGSDELPRSMREVFAELLASPAAFLFLDRANAPGVAGRLAALAELAGPVVGPRTRTTTCDYGLTRQVKEVYRHVSLPTTQHEDRPVRTCKTLWMLRERRADT